VKRDAEATLRQGWIDSAKMKSTIDLQGGKA
jgi:hypothetical protein